MDVRVAAAAVEVINYTVDLEDAACGVSLSCEALALSCSLLMNVPAPRPILPGYSAYSVKRRGSSLQGISHLHWRLGTAASFGHVSKAVEGPLGGYFRACLLLQSILQRR